ncbi:MAG: metallophosphoesterase [Proteobacteria bacterium]|nr:metallophosphoesterase [Pseudomonadota bacterium]
MTVGENGTDDVVLVHSSDLHVDNTDPDAIDGFHGLVGLQAVLERAETLAAAVVLLAGDTFENHRVAPAALRRTAALLGGARMPIVLLPGNHDSILPDCLFERGGLTALPNVHVLGVTHADSVRFAAHDLEICGLAHRGYDDMPPLHAPPPRTTRWRIVMAHGHYVPAHDWAVEAHRSWLISDDALAATDADYVALGHWDRAVQVGGGSVPAYYSGSPDLARTVNVIRLGRTSGVAVAREPLRRLGGLESGSSARPTIV